MLLGLAKELRDAGFPNIQDVQHRQGREFLASDGRVSVYSLGELAPPENWFIPTLKELIDECEKTEGYDLSLPKTPSAGVAAVPESEHDPL